MRGVHKSGIGRRELRAIGLTLALIGTWGYAFSGQTNDDAILGNARENYLARMSKAGIVGGTLVVLRPEREILEVDYGWASLERKTPAAETTIYDWGSITKLLTGLAVMQLEFRGLLRLDDALVSYVPAARRIKNPFRDTETITLRMLLTHTSGLQEASFLIPLTWDGDWPVWAQIEPNLNYLKVELKPGSGYLYSNLGSMLLGRVIEVVSGENYETYIDKNFFKPLNMPESYFNVTPYHLLDVKAQSYFAGTAGSPRRLYAPDLDQGFTATNGGWKGSVRDFKKFVRFLLGSADPAVQAVYDGILLRPKLESMWTPVVEAGQPNLAAGLAFLLKAEQGQFFIGSSGGTNGFVSNMFIHMETRTGVFMAGNTDNFAEVMRPTRDGLITLLAHAASRPAPVR